MTRNNLRKLHGQQSRMEEARKEYEEAPKIDRELAQKNPESYLPHLATRLKNLRKLDSDLKSAYR
jgi:5,10-methylenetetrahydrofolate reductase